MQRQKAHILIITPFFKPNVGGVETRFDNICKWLSDRGIKVTVLTYQPIITSKVRGKSYEKRDNIEIFRLWWPGFDIFHKLQKIPLLQVLYIVPGLLTGSFLYLLLNRKGIDIIHVAGFNSALVVKLLYPVFKIKWVMSTHAIYDFDKKNIISRAIKWILKDAYKIVAVSKLSKQELINIGIPEEKIVIHTTWVDQKIFRPLNKSWCREKLKLDNRVTVLFVGRLLKIKGVLALLKVAKDLKEINFVFIGDGPLRKELREASGIFTNVIYTGIIPNYELSLYYNAADVSIMPSLYKEPFGRVVLESLSCATPCICSNLGGIRSYLDSSVAYLLYPSISNIKRAILDLYHHQDKLKYMAQHCRKFAEKYFSPSNMSTLLEAYGFQESSDEND